MNKVKSSLIVCALICLSSSIVAVAQRVENFLT